MFVLLQLRDAFHELKNQVNNFLIHRYIKRKTYKMSVIVSLLSATLSHPKLLNCIVVDSETNRLNFAITANCIVVGNEINRLNFATVLNETGKLTAQVKF